MKNILQFSDVVKKRAWQAPISFTVVQGDMIALTGSNGSGKSTIIQLALGILQPDEGNIQLLGKNPHVSHSIRSKIAVAFQSYSFSPMIPIGESLRLHSALFKIPWSTIQNWLELFALSPKAKPFMLSGGQNKRAELIRALARDAEVYFLDEPLSGLDKEATKVLEEWLIDMKNKSKTIFLTSHNKSLINLMEREININKLVKGGLTVLEKNDILEIKVEGWKPPLESAIKKLSGVNSLTIEFDNDVLSKLGLPGNMAKNVIAIQVDDVDMEKLGGQVIPVQSGLNLFAKAKIIVETSGPNNVLPEIISLLSKAEVRITSVMES